MTDALGDALQRLVRSPARETGGLPRLPCDPRISPFIWVGEPDAHGWCAWQPVRKEGEAPLAEALAGLPPLHGSIHLYFDSWWFLELNGQLDDKNLAFSPNRPGLDPGAWVEDVRGYADAHGGRLDHVPIGFDDEVSLLMVVDNRTGALSIEDWETGRLYPIAASLDDALRRLIV